MHATHPTVLSLNGGSSSIRFAFYGVGPTLERRLHGRLDRIGSPAASLSFSGVDGVLQHAPPPAAGDPHAAVGALVEWLQAQPAFSEVSAIGHRVVHGMQHSEPEIVTPELLKALRGVASVDPDHLPGELDLIEALARRVPALPQVACFDTAFHRGMPRVATMLAIPRRFDALGVQRYGFHGLSYAYLMEELARAAGLAAAQGRVILAHLGHGASLAAVHNGVGIDTSMGFTPAAGLPMGTRSGDLDPGLALHLQRTVPMTAPQFDAMVNHASGLLGVSDSSADMRDLLAVEQRDVRAAEAVALFCYQAKKWVGAYAAALGGLETLVFAGGIGENAAAVRARICAGLGFLGIELDESRNAADEALISTEAGPVAVRVMHTDEALMIARSVCRVVGYASRPDELQP
jgi:acetate kinase